MLQSDFIIERTNPVAPPVHLRPMLNIAAARALLPEFDEDGILELIESGWIEYAFDIGGGYQSRRRELRILPASVENFRSNMRARKQPLGWDWPRVCKEILIGHSGSAISGVQARTILNCSITHLTQFIGTQLRIVPGTTFGPGPKGSAQIQVQSFLEFLRKRRIRSG